MGVMFVLAAVLAVSFGVLVMAGVTHDPAGFGGRWQGRFQFNPWYVLAAVSMAVAIFAFIGPASPFVLIALVVAMLFVREWVREWLFLMDLSDDHLPGRYDKPIWAVMLVVLPPVGAWLFRSYRLRRWPEVSTKPAPIPEVS